MVNDESTESSRNLAPLRLRGKAKNTDNRKGSMTQGFSPFTIHYSPFTIHHSRFTLHASRFPLPPIFDQKSFMYSAEQIRDLQEQTRTLLKTAAPITTAAEAEALRNVLRFHEHRYYIMNDPLIADVEYDQLFKKLEALEKEHPEWISPDSPTQRVA